MLQVRHHYNGDYADLGRASSHAQCMRYAAGNTEHASLQHVQTVEQCNTTIEFRATVMQQLEEWTYRKGQRRQNIGNLSLEQHMYSQHSNKQEQYEGCHSVDDEDLCPAG